MENSTIHFNIKQRKIGHLLIATFLAALVMFFLTIPYSVHAEESTEEETISSPTKTSSNKVTEKASTINEEESNLEEESHEESHSEAVESENNDTDSENEEVDSDENEQEKAIEDSENADNEVNDEDFDESMEDEAQENNESSDSDKEDDATEDEEDTVADSDKDNDKTEESDEDADTENPEHNDADSEVDSDEDDVDKETEDNDVESEDKDEIIESEDKEKSENSEEEKDEKKNQNQKESDSEKIGLHSAKEKSTIKKGDRDKRVIQMKKDLEKLGFKVPGNGTSLFGTETENKIKEFQKYYGLDVTGTFDNVTEKMLSKQSSSPLQKGKKHKDTKKLKKDLKKLGLEVPGNGTSLFGTKTEANVKKFQKREKLKINGIADTITLQTIKDLLNAPLSNGMRREDVKSLKKDLEKLGFKVPGNGTNLYGTQTEKKVKEFQKYYGVKITGVVNKSTKDKLDAQINSPLQKGKKHKDTKKLKEDLKKLGFKVPGNGTTLYGTKTETKVKALQKHYSLIINGIADEITLNKIKSVLKTPLQNGKKHKDTKKLKVDLAKIGYAVPGNGTTLYGTKTTASVKSFQKDNKLPVSGIADEVTLKKIATLVKQQAKKKVIYLDAGHGGTDPGASGHGLKEKDLVLDIAKRTQDKLIAAGFTVIMSRSTDKTVKLDERTKEANDLKADAFVSIHANSFNGAASGIETWKMSQGPKAKESNTLASYLQNEIIKNTKAKDRGVKDGNLHVNRESKMPSSLVEVGFIDNKSEVNNLKKASYKNKIATGITNGIKKFFNMI